LEEVKRQRDEAEKKLSSTQVTLKEALDEVKRTAKCARVAEKKVLALQKLNECRLADFNCLTEKFEEVEKQNFKTSEILTSVQNELATVTDATSITFDESTVSFTFETKCHGKQYSQTIQKLYYSLLSEQIPPAKISHTIKAVLKCFLPGLNVETLQLPKEHCAGYKRTDELKTVSLAHKATVIHKQIEEFLLHLNTDGTTLGQRNLDSAAIQKKFNCLIEEQKEADIATYGTNAPESAIEIVENLCAMHLGCNLRKAFLIGVKSVFESKENKDHSREYHQVDVFVHEFHKLFGKLDGTLEYGVVQ
uniref:Uncharacterized protein n=1 Tax=Amphimedon queenslandica TaxID=400682 RepID=A0A1X7VRB2_AMPQE